MQEIEIKLCFDDKEKVVSTLKNLGAKKVESFKLIDEYFSKSKSMKNSDELVRIRTKDDSSELTFKGECAENGNVRKRTELTTPVGDINSTQDILLNLGLNQLSRKESVREVWELGNAEFVFIRFTYPAELDLLEIEASSEKRVNELLKLFGDLVEPAGEEIFSVFDNKGK